MRYQPPNLFKQQWMIDKIEKEKREWSIYLKAMNNLKSFPPDIQRRVLEIDKEFLKYYANHSECNPDWIKELENYTSVI